MPESLLKGFWDVRVESVKGLGCCTHSRNFSISGKSCMCANPDWMHSCYFYGFVSEIEFEYDLVIFEIE